MTETQRDDTMIQEIRALIKPYPMVLAPAISSMAAFQSNALRGLVPK
jgi:hypothetical protein